MLQLEQRLPVDIAAHYLELSKAFVVMLYHIIRGFQSTKKRSKVAVESRMMPYGDGALISSDNYTWNENRLKAY